MPISGRRILPLAQEVLRCLHTHLGSKLPAQVNAALAALLRLSRAHADALLGYAAFLSGLMEYLEDLDSSQLLLVPFLALSLPPSSPACCCSRMQSGIACG
jgi:hypothetical protein